MIENYSSLKLEPEILDFWKREKIYEKLKKKTAKAKQFYFLDGPPYTSGRVHIGTALNKSLKDSFIRFKRMNGFNIWDRAGYDMHGLPTEHKVEERFGIKNKDEIPGFGVEKFVKACRELSVENMALMSNDFIRLGVWMDFENAYQSIDPVFIDGEWWLIKKAWENKRLYEGEKVMHWCPNCSTSLSKHELEYDNVKEDSIFLKFRLKNKKKEYLIIWTTTPWTIPYNLAVMVNPELEYLKVKVENEIWYVAKGLAGVFINGLLGKKFSILEEFKGDKLEGLEYEHPLYHKLKHIYDKFKNKAKNTHTVILTEEYVDLSAGTGLVHSAPGCGPEDYEVCHKYHIPPFNNLDENGVFPKEMGKFAGFTAKKDDNKLIEEFRKLGVLIETTEVEHEYAHCWRCHLPVIFRTTKQWFFKVEDLKEKMREFNKKIFWQPGWAGSRQFDSWLNNLRDNGITRQRYWGCPAPIWKCEKCKDITVIGSREELKKLAGKLPEDMHLPWIDRITIKCSKCNSEKKRIPDILDVWVDAGTNSWTCLDYPANKELFKKLWPADFILEGKDQIRGWFNLLFVCSMISMQKPSYKAVYMHGFVNDALGRKQSKSLGNYILPEEVISKYGADTLRYYMIGGAEPGEDINYNFDDMKIKNGNLMILWNLHKFLIELSKNIGKTPDKLKNPEKNYSIEEKYIVSKLNSAIQKATKLFNDYKLNQVPLAAEELFLELSRTYIKMIRDKSSSGKDKEKEAVLGCINNVLIGCLKIFAPIAPFITEKIYQNLREEFRLKEESIHLLNWPKSEKKKIDAKLEKNMGIVSNVLQSAFSAREKIALGLKWPVKYMTIVSTNKDVVNAVEEIEDIIKNQVNVKEIRVQETMPGVKLTLKPNISKIGPEFGAKANKIISHIATQDSQEILSMIDKKGSYDFLVDKEAVRLTKLHLYINREIPEQFAEGEFKGGLLYLSKERTPELEAEGYSREIMRKIQSQRKTAGLDKTDSIILFIEASKVLIAMLKPWESKIGQKCGASKIKISHEKPAKKYEFSSREKIKEHTVVIYFDKE